MTKKDTGEAQPNLEKLFGELEGIAEEMSSGRLDLEMSLSKFERGLAISELLKQRLAEIENKIETIKVKFKNPADEKD